MCVGQMLGFRLADESRAAGRFRAKSARPGRFWMRRSLARAMISLLRTFRPTQLVLFVAQSSGVALADAGRPAGASFNVTELMASMRALIATLGASSGRTPPLMRRAPLPLRSAPDYADPKRFTRLIRKPREAAKTVIAARPIDLVKVRRRRHAEKATIEHTGLSIARASAIARAPLSDTSDAYNWHRSLVDLRGAKYSRSRARNGQRSQCTNF